MQVFEGLNWIEIVKGILLVLIGAGVTYYKTSPKLRGKHEEAADWLNRLRSAAAKYIAEAEAAYVGAKQGGKRFEWVVDRLYDLLPVAIRPFIGREMIGDIVQSTFDIMADFARRQTDRLVDGISTPKTED